MLQHIIISHHGEPEFGAIKPPSTPEALAVHAIENMDAKLMMALSATRAEAATGADGNFTEYMKAFSGRLYRPDVAPADAPDGIEPGGDGMRLGPGLIHEEGVDRELGRVVPRRRERQRAGLLEEPVGFPAADARRATVDEDVRQEPAEAAAARVDQRNPEAIVALRTPAPLRVLGIKRSHPQRVGAHCHDERAEHAVLHGVAARAVERRVAELCESVGVRVEKETVHGAVLKRERLAQDRVAAGLDVTGQVGHGQSSTSPMTVAGRPQIAREACMPDIVAASMHPALTIVRVQSPARTRFSNPLSPARSR